MSRATSTTSLEPEKDSRAHNVQALAQGQCTPMPLPSLGTQRIIQGNGTNVGTIISLQCPDHHTLMGGHVVCEMRTNSTQWVGEPYCKPASVNAEIGFRVAVYASAVSSCIIMVLSMAFITCCLHERFNKTKRRRQRSEMEEQEWLRDQCAGARAGCPRHQGRNHNNNNSNRQQKSVAMCWGGHGGALAEDKATHGAYLHPYCNGKVPSSAPLPGKGFYQSPVTRDARPDQEAAGPLQNSHYPQGLSPAQHRCPCQPGCGAQESGQARGLTSCHGYGHGACAAWQFGWPDYRMPLLTELTSQESCILNSKKKECSIRVISV